MLPMDAAEFDITENEITEADTMESVSHRVSVGSTNEEMSHLAAGIQLTIDGLLHLLIFSPMSMGFRANRHPMTDADGNPYNLNSSITLLFPTL